MSSSEAVHVDTESRDHQVRSPVIPSVNGAGASRRALGAWCLANGPAVVAGLLCGAYLLCFFSQLSSWWFNPRWLTDDSLQQTYPFYKILEPDLFKGDLITQMMERYLTPLHYWCMAFFTILTGDPIQAGHWVHLVQFGISATAVLFGVQAVVGWAPAFFAVGWLVHTRHVMQRLTGGLPRGWALVIIALALCGMLRRSHRMVLTSLALGCLAHPPAAMLCGLTYGVLLCIESLRVKEARRKLFHLCLLTPVYALVTYYVVRMPPEIGVMADFKTASAMPEFLPGGRFPFLPLLSREQELSTFGLQAFISRVATPQWGLGPWIPWLVSTLLLAVIVGGWLRGIKTLPLVGAVYGLAALVMYELSRIFAFKLYVPNRHLQIPMAMFFVVFLTIGLWRLITTPARDTSPAPASGQREWWGLLALSLLGGFVFLCSGSGIQGAMNFNVPKYRGGGVWQWLEANTPRDAVIAGHPTFMDHTQLFAKRPTFVSTEVAHPFYDRYYAEIKRRLDVSLRAFYAKDLRDLYALLVPEGVSYFVFDRKRFYPQELQHASYFRPFDEVVRQLVADAGGTFAYRQIPHEKSREGVPFLVFRDREAAVIDLAKLGEFLGLPPPATLRERSGMPSREGARELASEGETTPREQGLW